MPQEAEEIDRIDLLASGCGCGSSLAPGEALATWRPWRGPKSTRHSVMFLEQPGPRSREEIPASSNEALQATNGPSTAHRAGAHPMTGPMHWGVVVSLWSMALVGAVQGALKGKERKKATHPLPPSLLEPHLFLW
jgi:hypothetical protein